MGLSIENQLKTRSHPTGTIISFALQGPRN